MQLGVTHRTTYRFNRPIVGAIQLLRLTPLSCLTQTVLNWRIEVDRDARLRETRDGYGNCVHMLYVEGPVGEMTITANGRVITEDRAGVIEGLPNDLPPDVFRRPTLLTRPDSGLAELAAEVGPTPGSSLAVLHALNTAVHQRMNFQPGATEAQTPAAIAYESRRGVCQDFTHIFIAAARLCGIPARYISGHLFRPDGNCPQAAGHAWAEAWVSDLGWVAFDPANGICADGTYVRVAAGLDYGDAAPIAGSRRGGGTESMTVEVVVSLAPRTRRQSQRQGPQSQVQTGSGSDLSS